MSRPGALAAALVAAALAACAPLPDGRTAAPAAPTALPPMKTFGPHHAAPTRRSNASIARDFMALAFELESGRQMTRFSRFEGPITLRVTGRGLPPVSQRDLDLLLKRLRDEASIDIRRASGEGPASITLEVLRRNELHRLVPQAACFVAPNVSSWAEFRARRNSAALDWTTLGRRERMAVFLPGDVSPQELRDCMHEEIAQALGPVNDLYSLKDSIFNDDNFHTVLTGFDMAILRAHYDDALRAGMGRDAVAARLPAVLARTHPQGRGGGAPAVSPTPRAWIAAIERALGSGGSASARLAAARKALAIAREQRWNDNRTGFSLYVLGRLALSSDGALALSSFAEAEQIFRADPATRLHAAHVSVQAAAYALSSGRPERAIAIVDDNSAVALEAQNAGLLAAMLLIKAQALETLGREGEAAIVRRDGLGWARYGFGSEREIAARLNEIAALAPPARKTAGGTQ